MPPAVAKTDEKIKETKTKIVDAQAKIEEKKTGSSGGKAATKKRLGWLRRLWSRLRKLFRIRRKQKKQPQQTN